MPAKRYLEVGSVGIPTERAATVTSAGAGSDGDLVALDASGRLDNSVLPVGIGADTKVVEASEALNAGDLVNIHNASGAKARKADASAANAGRVAHGFVLSSVASGANATVYFEGTITGLTGLTAGATYYASATPGIASTTPPAAGTGHTLQSVGVAISTTELSFEPGNPIIRA